MGAASRHELPQRLEAEWLVGGDRGVLPVSIVGVVQIELEVLGTFMLNVPAVDRDAQRALPRRDLDRGLESLQVGGQAGPPALPLDQELESQPGIERDLDRVLSARSKPGHDFRPEERAVEPHLDREEPAQKALYLSEQVAQERQRGLAVMDVAGAIPYPQHMPGLRQIGGDRVVARDLAMVWIVTAEGALDGQPGRDHGPVHIDCNA